MPSSLPSSPPTRKLITDWSSPEQLLRNAFYTTETGDQAQMRFVTVPDRSYLALGLSSRPDSNTYTACRITEIESGLPIAARQRIWHATATTTIVVRVVLRFEQAAPPPGLIENIGLWNAPLPSKKSQEAPIPLSGIGLTRSFGAYVAMLAQGLNLLTASGGLTHRAPLPSWLDPSDWHEAQLIVTPQHVTLTVAQHAHPHTPLLDLDLPEPLEPLAFEASVDNDRFPQPPAPVTIPDTLYLAHLDIQARPT